MDAIANILQPYKELIGSVAAIVTIGQMFSGTFMCWDIYKQGNTRGISIMPFLGGIVISVLNLKYGYILRDDTMIQVNLAGLALNIIYVLIFFQYTSEKLRVWGQMGLAGAFSAALIGYAEMEDPKLVEYRFGMIITVFMFYLLAMPLFSLSEIIKNQSSEGMPFPMILSGTMVTFMWLLYGLTLRNSFIVVQNIIAFLLCGFQLALCIIYPAKPSKAKAKSKAKKAD